MERMNGQEAGPLGDHPIKAFDELRTPPSPEPDHVPETQADLDPTLVRNIGDFRKSLGLPRGPGFLDESDAPPLNLELVEAYVDRTLEREQSAMVFELSTKYRSWNQTVHEHLLARARAEVVGDSPDDP